MRQNIAIVGGGIIGSALAFELAQRGAQGIHVFDADLEGPLSSTERNAGGVRHLWMHAINAELSRISIQFFEKFREEVGFKQNGYLWLYSPQTAPLGERALGLSKTRGLDYRKFDQSEICARYPFMDRLDDVEFAIYGHKDGILNSNALKTFLRSGAKKTGVIFHDLVHVSHLEEKNHQTFLHTSRFPTRSDAMTWLSNPTTKAPSQVLTFEKTVICNGAWASILFADFGYTAITRPVRRQIAFFAAEELDLSPYGMVVDTSKVYFHAEGGKILAGLVLPDEPSGFNFSFDASFFEKHIWPALYNRSSHFERLKFISGWSGLYSYTPDITGILGRVPEFQNIYESHSYTGHGVMHSIGAAKALADLLTLDRFEMVDARCLSRDRFSQGRLLEESLHI